MKTVLCFLAAALLCMSTLSPAEAAKKKKKNNASNNGDVVGTVVSTSNDSVTVKVAGPKKKSPSVDRKFELAQGAKIENLNVSKKAFGIRSGTINDLKAGDRVVVQLKPGSADQADRILHVATVAKKKKAAE